MQLPAIQIDVIKNIAKLLTEGNAINDVVEFILVENPEVQREQILNAGFDWFVSASNIPEKYIKGWCYEAFRELYRKLIEVGDYNSAIKCVKEINLMSVVKDKSGKEIKGIGDEIDFGFYNNSEELKLKATK